jgi:hypothetical protein
MAAYRVVCVNKATTNSGTHQHITHLGVGDGTSYTHRLTVAAVIAQLRSPRGDRFYTVSPAMGQQAYVVEGSCEVCGQRPYVRTTADGQRDNNLSNLPRCQL